MALINQAMQGTPGPAQPQPAQPAAGGPPSSTAAKKIVAAGLTALNNPQVEQAIMQLVQAGPTPVEGIANAVLYLMKALYEKSGRTMPMGAAARAAAEIAMEIIKMAHAAKMLKGAQPNLLAQVMSLAMQKLQQQMQGQAQPQAAPQPAQPAPQGA